MRARRTHGLRPRAVVALPKQPNAPSGGPSGRHRPRSRASAGGPGLAVPPDMVTLQLSPDDARFLAEQLENHLTHVEQELVRTDAFTMQHELRVDFERLALLRNRLVRALESLEVAA